MLAGRPAFAGRTLLEIAHATRYEQPPALTGSPAVAALDRVIRRALAKRPSDRPPTAEAMAGELRALGPTADDRTPALARALTRLVVLPFRVLRPDPETDFLAFSLPDAISTSLSGHGSLIVRSSAIAARFTGETPDLKALATEGDVDVVVMGTLMRSGDQLRAAAQLVEASGGTLLTSHTVQSSLGDLFTLQDDIARRVADALALPLTVGPISPASGNAPDARAYELYLRANELARTYNGLVSARDLYRSCLEFDSRFAPAWAHLGRCHRVIGKYIDASEDSEANAEEAFRRALALSPRLTIAHKFFAHLEADMGRAQDALVRLLGEAERHGNDPELFAGLVHACRYCGLLDQSIAAHVEARRLDPNVPTSVEQTLLMTGDVDRLLAIETPRLIAGADDGIRVIGLGLAGRRDEARRRLVQMRQVSRIPAFESWIDYLTAWLERRREDMNGRMSTFKYLKIQNDPEAVFQEAWLLCDLGDYETGLAFLERAMEKNYWAVSTLTNSRQFDGIRGTRDSITWCAQHARDGTVRLPCIEVPVENSSWENERSHFCVGPDRPMRTLTRDECDTLIRRLRSVRPDTERQWGRMTAHQMVCHLADVCRMAIGEVPVRDTSNALTRTIVKWVALYLPLRWRPGIVTSAEIDQCAGAGTRPGLFAADVGDVETLLTTLSHARRNRRLAGASGFWTNVPLAVDALGVPAHRSSSSAVQSHGRTPKNTSLGRTTQNTALKTSSG